MALTAIQQSVLAYVIGSGWASARDVAAWAGCSPRSATTTLAALQRRGLVVHSDVVARWSATPRAEKVMTGLDARMKS